MRFVSLLMCSLLLISSCKKDKIQVDTDQSYLNFNFSTADDSLFKGVPQNDMSNYDSVFVLLYAYNYKESYNPVSLPSTLTSYGRVKLSNAGAMGTAWSYAPPKFWPTNRKLAFFAYSSDVSFNDAGISISNYKSGIPTITYIVPTDIQKQPDLLVSTPLVDMSDGASDDSNKIKITMNHALSCIGFVSSASTPETSIESITIKNVCGAADLDMLDIQIGVRYPEIKWKNHRNYDVTFSVGINRVVDYYQDLPKDLSCLISNQKDLMNEDGYLMMIPQVINTGAKIVVEYTNNEKREFDIPPIEWKAGKKYIYSL